MLGTRASDNTCAIVYLNAVGGQDELVFDGHSLVVGPTGDVLFRCKAFEEQLAIVDIDLVAGRAPQAGGPAPAKGQAASWPACADVPEVELEPDAPRADRNGDLTPIRPSRRVSSRRSTRRWCSARGTTSTRTASRKSCWA